VDYNFFSRQLVIKQVAGIYLAWYGIYRDEASGGQPGLQPPYRPWEHTAPLSPAYRHEEEEEGKEGREEEEEEAALAPV
jgi:hypothetical protein